MAKGRKVQGGRILSQGTVGVFFRSSFRNFFSTFDSVTACREKRCCRAEEKEGEASGIATLEGVGDEEMLDGQGGVAESNRNPDLTKW